MCAEWYRGRVCKKDSQLVGVQDDGRACHSLSWCACLLRGASVFLSFFLSRGVQGIFPANHVQLRKCTLVNAGVYEAVVPAEDPVARETAEVIREWGQLAIVNFQVISGSIWD